MPVIRDSEKWRLKRTLKAKDSLLQQIEHNKKQTDYALAAQQKKVDSLLDILSEAKKKVPHTSTKDTSHK